MIATHTLRACWLRRELLRYLVVVNLKLSRKDKLLGYVWWVLDPLLLTLVYWLLVNVIFDRGGPDYAFFILCALIPFRALSVSMGQSANSLVSKFSLIGQINFPRIFLPVSDVIANHVKLLFGFVVVMAFGLFFGVVPGPGTLWALVPFVLQVILLTGIGMLISLVTVFVRDVQNVMQFLIRSWLYLSPVLYSLDRVPDALLGYFLLNPMVPIVIMYREAFMLARAPALADVALASLHAAVFLAIGYVLFVRYEGRILKAV